MKISVIIPNYNCVQYLEEAIESVLAEDYCDKEVIVIDGNSTDGSVEIVKKYASNLAYWVSEPDDGQTDAISKGMAVATGDIVNWLNSDDRLVQGALRRIAEGAAAMPEADFLYGDTEVILDDGSVFQTRAEINFNRFILRYGGNVFAQPSCFFKKCVIDRIGGLDASLHWSMDYDFWIRAAARGASFRRVDEVISQFRLHGGSKTGSQHDKMRAQHLFCHQRLTRNPVLRQVPVYRSLKLLARAWRLVLLYRQRGVWQPGAYSKVLKAMNERVS